ncbi:hypothetical protein [Williamsia sp. CHRR-6]|uniref:hypothetical protein n=1 Tax=Williamsia sp. CHRR-6 TaxID=2835871 RepID=UPI001BDB5588|nr:hypothetical protein [Williamsia sp. CHRR-6]MBT0565651.1 hypothetical protein [Williamsia sp. CHRR-6]
MSTVSVDVYGSLMPNDWTFELTPFGPDSPGYLIGSGPYRVGINCVCSPVLCGVSEQLLSFTAMSDLRYVGVRSQLHDSAPTLEIENWDDSGEVSITYDFAATFGFQEFAGPAEYVDGVLKTFQVPPGTYRVRVYSRGRGEVSRDIPEVPDQPRTPDTHVEQFLIQLWPDTTIRPPETFKSLNQT